MFTLSEVLLTYEGKQYLVMFYQISIFLFNEQIQRNYRDDSTVIYSIKMFYYKAISYINNLTS